MKKQLTIIGIIAMLVLIGLSGCNQISNTLNPEKNKFVGTWTATSNLSSLISYTDTFFPNGTGSWGIYKIKWEIKDGKIVSITSDQSLTFTYEYGFSNNDRTLTLTTPNETITLTKQ